MNIDVSLGIGGAVAMLGLCATCSAIGMERIASAVVGSWKKCYLAGKPAPFILLSYIGVPTTQTLYGMILMFVMIARAKSPDLVPGAGITLLSIGIFAGIVIRCTSYLQARVSANAAVAHAETGTGLVNYFSAIGIIEVTSIFMMIFTLMAVGNLVASPELIAELPLAEVLVEEVAEAAL